ncbi:carbon-nitrogen hydrolase [Xylariaceae sp. FL0662B]|nr:carbon-nitrogen hydrolase [Xylariaceae sp. FL0662B]
MTTSSKIRLATASPGTQGTTKETLAQLYQIARRAAANKADILLLPEAYLGGYPRGSDFGCRIGARTAEGRDEYLHYFKGAVDLGDTVGGGAGAGEAWVKRRVGSVSGGKDGNPSTVTFRGDGTREEIEGIARDTGVFIVVGLVEKAGGSLYCSVIYVCPKLGAIGKRRKVMPTGTERLIWAQGSPATLRAVSTTIRGVRINLAAAICWENYMPLLRQAIYAQNVNLFLAPTADNRDAWLALMRTVALEGRCFVVSSNMCVRGGGSSANFHGHSHGHDHGVVIGVGGRGTVRARRNSCFTEEGFEIALPTSPDAGKTKDKGGHGTASPSTSSAAVFEEEREEHDAGRALVRAPQEADGGGSSSSINKNDGFVSHGGSSIVSPFGDVLAGPQWEDDEGIIYADVDFDDCIRGRLDLDTAGSYSRNDSFKFSVEGLDLDPLPY